MKGKEQPVNGAPIPAQKRWTAGIVLVSLVLGIAITASKDWALAGWQSGLLMMLSGLLGGLTVLAAIYPSAREWGMSRNRWMLGIITVVALAITFGVALIPLS